MVQIKLNNKCGCSTIDNYTYKFTNLGGVSHIHKTTAKTMTQFIAERSIRNSIANLALIRSTHFVTVEKENLDICNKLKGLLKDTQIMYNYVVENQGCL